MSSKSKLPFVLGSIYDMYVDRSRYIEALCPRAWKVYGNESTVQTCVDQILTLQRDARAGAAAGDAEGGVGGGAGPVLPQAAVAHRVWHRLQAPPGRCL